MLFALKPTCIMYKFSQKTCKTVFFSLVIIIIIWSYVCYIIGAYDAFELAEYGRLNNISVEPHGMYQSLFPFGKMEYVYWWLASQTLWWWVGLTFNTMTHVVFSILLIYAATQLELLQIRLRNCIEPDFSETPSKMLIKEKVLMLRQLTQDHKYIIA